MLPLAISIGTVCSLLAEAEPRSVSSVLLLSAEIVWEVSTVEGYSRVGSIGNV